MELLSIAELNAILASGVGVKTGPEWLAENYGSYAAETDKIVEIGGVVYCYGNDDCGENSTDYPLQWVASYTIWENEEACIGKDWVVNEENGAWGAPWVANDWK